MAERFQSPLDRLRREWDERAAADALHHSSPRPAVWSRDEFLASGRSLVRDRLAPAWAELRAAAADSAEPRVLDLGCGAGRLLPALLDLADAVDGVDISPRMLRRAAELVGDGAGLRLLVSDGMTLQCVRRQRYDLAVCIDVLAHQPDDGIRRYLIGQIVDRLRLGGRAAVEIPAWPEPRLAEIVRIAGAKVLHREALDASLLLWLAPAAP